MNTKVGALLVQNNCLLLTLKTNILGTTYDFPMWNFETGNFPIELINKKVASVIGIENDNKSYMGTFDTNKNKIYLYLITNWKGDIQAKDYVWVHKSVLMSNINSLPFDEQMLQEIFK
jgi:hypothetical protein